MNTIRAGIRKVWAAFWMCLFRLWPIDRNKIAVSDLSGRGYVDNPRAVVDSLLARRPGVRVVWSIAVGDASGVPEPIQWVRLDSVRYFYTMATAAVWLNSSREHVVRWKRPGQYYIQLWHGDIPLKRLEAEAADKLSRSYVALAKKDGAGTDLMVSGSRLFTELCRSIFWFGGEVLECGVPRLDRAAAMTDAQKEAVRRRVGVPDGARAVLYAPTFRKGHRTDCYDMDYDAVLRQLEQSLGGRWVLLLRLHPHLVREASLFPDSDRVLNVTAYPDLYELLPAADMVISDYSNVQFEAAILGKPVMLYASDIGSYQDDRGFRFDLRELPFPLAEDTAALAENIRRFDPEAHRRQVKNFLDGLGVLPPGHAAGAVAERILDVMDGHFPPKP